MEIGNVRLDYNTMQTSNRYVYWWSGGRIDNYKLENQSIMELGNIRLNYNANFKQVGLLEV